MYLFETKVSVICCFEQLRNTSVITAADCASGLNVCKKMCLTDTVTVFCGVFLRVIKLCSVRTLNYKADLCATKSCSAVF